MTDNHRSIQLEVALQEKLDRREPIWAVGDIHGHHDSFRALLSKLDTDDCVVCLGDLIDRGPRSAQVLELVRDSEHICSLKGNHESMMEKALSTNKRKHWKSWLKYGGEQTLDSINRDRAVAISMSPSWLPFLSALPSEIVLNGHRLVHAGYDMEKSLGDQTENDRLWSRGLIDTKEIPDESRQVIFGHTPIQTKGHDPNMGPWKSKIDLPDGRNSLVGLDTGICMPRNDNPKLTAFNIQDGSHVSVDRIEDY